MIKRRSFAILSLGIISVLLFSALAIAQTAADSPNMENLYGSWNVEVTTPDMTFPGLITFGAEGSVITDRPPVPGETTGHGTWVSRDDGTAAYTFVSLFGDEKGAYFGRTQAVGTLQYDADTDRWQGPFRFDGFNAEGEQDFSVSGTFVLTRIVVESLD
jgi:hypothetical protein